MNRLFSGLVVLAATGTLAGCTWYQQQNQTVDSTNDTTTANVNSAPDTTTLTDNAVSPTGSTSEGGTTALGLSFSVPEGLSSQEIQTCFRECPTSEQVPAVRFTDPQGIPVLDLLMFEQQADALQSAASEATDLDEFIKTATDGKVTSIEGGTRYEFTVPGESAQGRYGGLAVPGGTWIVFARSDSATVYVLAALPGNEETNTYQVQVANSIRLRPM